MSFVRSTYPRAAPAPAPALDGGWPSHLFASLSGSALQPSARLGAWRVERMLGRGATGVVWSVRHLTRGAIALKVAHGPAISFARFETEAAMMDRVRGSQWVPRTRAVGVLCDRRAFLAMDIAPEGTLSMRHAWSPEDVFALARSVLHALEDVHRGGVVHCDVKLDNVVGSARRCQLVDFGISRHIGEVNRTPEGAPGTPSYMSPEQLRGDVVGVGADLYGVGVLIYRLLRGAMPFTGRTSTELYQEKARARFFPITHARPDAPIEIDRAMRCWLAADPERRPPSARAMRAMMAELQALWSERTSWRRSRSAPLALSDATTRSLPSVG